MADITMCEGKGCKLTKTCYRNTAVPNEFRQSYFAKSPLGKDGSCKHYYKK